MKYTVGQKIKGLRNANEMSQRKFAYALGASTSRVNDWENDKVLPGYNSLTLVCQVFNIHSSYFFDSLSLEEHLEMQESFEISQSISQLPAQVKNSIRESVKHLHALHLRALNLGKESFNDPALPNGKYTGKYKESNER